MEQLVCFEENEGQKCIIRFVKGWRRGRWFRREKIWYSYTDVQTYADEETLERVKARVKQDYPHAKIHCEDWIEFTKKYQLQKFWVIGRWNKKDREEFYTGNDQFNKPTYSEDMQEVRMMFAKSSARETLRTIQQTTRDSVYIRSVYLNLVNELLTPMLMITCTSKGNEQTKYFRKIDGNRLRLVSTSEAATKFTYENVIQMWEFLKTHNKNFLYAVLPAFKDNVNCKDIESYMRENKVSRMIVMDMQLKFLNR